MEEKDNIIPFPKLKQKKLKSPPSYIKAKLSYVLVALILGVTAYNSNFTLLESKSYGGRSIASIDVLTRDERWEKQLAKELSQSVKNRSVASIGRRPTMEERLRFELLEGKYSFHFDKGQIKEIFFSQNVSRQEEPKYLEDRMGFLKKYQTLLSVEFDEAVDISKSRSGEHIIETYRLVDKQTSKSSEVKFKLDKFGRLLSINVSQ